MFLLPNKGKVLYYNEKSLKILNAAVNSKTEYGKNRLLRPVAQLVGPILLIFRWHMELDNAQNWLKRRSQFSPVSFNLLLIVVKK